MPRLIYWNVEHFSKDKFYNRLRKRSRDDEDVWGVNRADELRTYLVPTLTLHDPDFIVIVEIRPGAAGLPAGGLLYDEGTLSLLHSLRSSTLNQWSLVPPLILGQNGKAEGIAVFYRRDRYFFTGPWRWPGGAGGVAGPVATIGAPGFYPSPWKRGGRAAQSSALPLRFVPGGAPINAGQREDKLAGQWRFTGTAHNVGGYLRFPGPATDFRTPFLTTFWDNVNARVIKLLAFHAPPDQDVGGNVATSESTIGTRRLSYITAIQAIAANEKQVIVGDFNVSVFDGAATAPAYGRITGAPLNFGQLIQPTPYQNPDAGYVCTHIKNINEAAPWDTDGYPGFSYQTVDDLYGQYDSIDNAFRRFGGGVGPAPASNITIVNRLTGSPYNAVPTPPGCPPGHFLYFSGLADLSTLNSPNGIDPDAMNADDKLIDFRQPDNYGLIRQTSDHLPLLFDF